MTELRVEPYVIPSADIGPENPFPFFRSQSADIEVKLSPDIPKEDRRYIGWQAGYRVLPYRMQDGYNRCKKPKSFTSLVLENEYLRAVFLPELGGRLVSLIYKPDDRELLECNPVFQPANLALRNAWFSGGIEWNTSHFGHHYLTCSPVFAARVKGISGEPALRLYEWDRVKCFPWQIDFDLPPGSRFLFSRVRLVNPHDREIPMYWWTNMAVPELPDGRVIVPADTAIHNTPEGLALTGLPYLLEKDLTYPTNHSSSKEFFFRIPSEERKWIAMLDQSGSGFVHTSTDRLRGRKFFCWGMSRGGRRWQEYLSVPGKAYIEIQAGLAGTQIECVPMPASSEWTWTEAYGPINCSPDKAHSVNWHEAVNAVKTSLETLLPGNELERVDSSLACVTARMPEEILFNGSGWGALEKARIITQNQEDRIPSELVFSESTLGPDQKPWLTLLESGILPETDPSDGPGQYMVQPEWLELLAESIMNNRSDHWLSWLHLGNMKMESFDTAGAEEAWKISISRLPTSWALRNQAYLENLRDNAENAFALLDKAWQTGPRNGHLAVEYVQSLVKLEKYDRIKDFASILPPEILQLERIQVALVKAKIRTGEFDGIEEFFNRDFVTIREGEITLTDLWFEFHERRTAAIEDIPIDDNLRARVRREFLPPQNINFRMSHIDNTPD